MSFYGFSYLKLPSYVPVFYILSIWQVLVIIRTTGGKVVPISMAVILIREGGAVIYISPLTN